MDAIDDGDDGIPGGDGNVDFDVGEYDLDDDLTSGSKEQVAAELEALKERAEKRREEVRAWYGKQREAALKGVYSPKEMKNV